MNTQIDSIRTLVVDDSEDECALLEAELETVHSIKLIGFVHDGVEAICYLRGIEQFKNRETHPYPDLLLLDYSMPGCDGMQVLRFLQRQSRRPRVILWSNTLDAVSVPLALRLGADLVCRKPVNKRELTEVLDQLEATVLKAATPLLFRDTMDEALCGASG
jgi:CheY-like chemotaxis protein